MYGCTTWTLRKCLKKKIHRNYTRMLYVLLNKSWKQYSTKQQLYSHWPPISQTIQVRWVTGHYWKSKDKLKSGIFQWTPTHGHTNVGWPAKDFHTSTLCRHQMQSRGPAWSDWLIGADREREREREREGESQGTLYC